MKKIWICIVVAALCCGRGFAQLLPNPDLNQQLDGQLTDWGYGDKTGFQRISIEKTNVSSTDIKISRLEEPSGSGRYFLRLESDGKRGDESIFLSTGQYPVPAGFTYELTFEYRATGLMPESGDRTKYAAAVTSVFCEIPGKTLAAPRIMAYNNSADWTKLQLKVPVPVEATVVQIRPDFRNKYPNNPVRVDYRNFDFVPLDYTLPNSSFEQADKNGSVQFWRPFGTAGCNVVNSPARTGTKAVEVKDAPAGLFSGWSMEVPVRPDREYEFKGFGKCGDLKAGGPITGALSLQFLDRAGQPLGSPVFSKSLQANSDWTELATPKTTAPQGAFTARLVAGMQYCGGSTWFDDLSLEMNPVVAADVARVLRPDPKPSQKIAYAKNLLKNGDIESGAGDTPAGWTYVGKSEPNWTEDEISRYHGNGRPEFAIGRGKGEWSRGLTYAGKGALVNISVEPPVSRKIQWYGRNPVDGYWFSDPVACVPGKSYQAGAWIRPGLNIDGSWYGPLEIQFFDKNQKRVPLTRGVRTMLGGFPANEWNYWFSPPHVAPPGAANMRLRFGQEFAADKGGWGKTYADNIAIWELPPEADIEKAATIGSDNLSARAWFSEAHARTKPPYLPSPAEAPEYESVWGTILNTTPGNIFAETKSDVKLRLSLFNALGEDRSLSVKVLRTDWLGKASAEFVSSGVTVPAYSQAPVEINLPPMSGYGAFHLECALMEGDAKVGSCSGRYAVIPPLQRQRTRENIWAVTLLRTVYGDNRPSEKELAHVLRVAGFGMGWARDYGNPSSDEAMRETRYFRSLGMKVILQLQPPLAKWDPKAAFEPAPYFEYGKRIASEFKGLVVAYGNWGIEQANNRTAARPVYRPIKNGQFMSDLEYDKIWLAVHDGIRSVDQKTPILIGNIATDMEAAAIKRMYVEPAKGQFDGAILNAYSGLLTVAQSALAEFDKHNDTSKTIWQEENANQRSPIAGAGRRYGEGDGAGNMVRSWVALACKAHPRIRAITQWGFSPRNRQDDMADATMMDIGYQPRPHFVAHAIMADALADAEYKTDLSTADFTLFEFKRSDDTLLIGWSNAGECDVTFEAAGNGLVVMDIMGNRNPIESKGGLATVKFGTNPVYISNPSPISISTRVGLKLQNATRQLGKPQLGLIVRNNQSQPVSGDITFSGPVSAVNPIPFSLEPGATRTFTTDVPKDLGEGKSTTFKAACRTSEGAVFSAACTTNFAQAVKAKSAPSLDGTWKDWASAQVIPFGEAWQAVAPTVPGESYRGGGDIRGNLRVMWDDNCLYLGVESLDDQFLPQSERGMNGFMGDSIEFAFQSENLRNPTATMHEYELYLPGGAGEWAASRRSPRPTAMIESGWKGVVKPTGAKGNVNYQVAIPWQDLGIDKVAAGRSLLMALVLNDADKLITGGGRKRIKWFDGIDNDKSPEKFGEVILVNP